MSAPRMKRNPGYCPEEAKGKRVRVQLANGIRPKDNDGPGMQPGWAADGKGGCRWSRTGSPHDIEFYAVVK